ncbi:MAG: hypothetical protein ABI839_08585, partial [Verrucomicrobiota bacterium]
GGLLWRFAAGSRASEDKTATLPNEQRNSLSAVIPAKSIAVLPFENLSEEKANAFFASGIQDEILTALAKISGLKVISRTSTARYEHRPENLPEIGRALGVAHILEGTVQKVGEKVHVNVQLIRADSDAHIWAQSYDRSLADVFAVEAEVAATVADELRTTLSPGEHTSVEKKPTENAEAYTWYLKGREAEAHPDISLTYFHQAEDYYSRAIALDPGFALARAHLAHMIAQTYHEFEPTPERSRRARAEAEEALRLNPNLGEAHLALADWFYWIAFDYDAALHEFEVAGKLLPNSVDVALGQAAIRRRQGRWQESIQHHERAIRLDPRSAGIITELIYTKFYLRDWESATALAKQALSIDPTSPTCITFRSFAEYWRTGDAAQGEAMFDKNRSGPDVDNTFFMTKFEYAMIRRDFARAEHMLASNPEEVFSIPSLASVPRSFLEASITLARGENAAAIPHLEKAAAFYEKLIAEAPEDANRRAACAMIYAYLGRKEDALREIDRARELRSESKDTIIGRQISAIRAQILARIGEADQSISEIERLLTLAGPVDFWFPSITQVDLKHRWIWDPLRNDPRFQKILASPEPTTRRE